MKILSGASGRKFIEVLNDVKAQVTSKPSEEREPFLLDGWLDGNDLGFLAKQAFSLTRGCLRHLFYLILHLGICSNCHDVTLLTGLIREYRQEFLKALWGAFVQRHECGIEVMGKRLEHADHLHYLIVQRLVLYHNKRMEAVDIAHLHAGPPGALRFQGTISYSEARLLRRARPFSPDERRGECLFRHLLFLALLHGQAADHGRSQLNSMQEAYGSHIRTGLMGYIVKPSNHENAGRDMDGESAGSCTACSHWCRGIFDLRADEHLVKIGSHYMILAASLRVRAEDSQEEEPNPKVRACR